MNEPLRNLRRLMAERQIDAYLVPAGDYHQSEYFSPHFWATRFLSRFTGESCTLVITAEEAMLWTDGRFFLQAEEQMDEEFTLCRMDMPGVPTVDEYLKASLPEGGCLGFDGRLISARRGRELMENLREKRIRFAWEEDLVDRVWPGRPALVSKPAFLLDVKYAGESAGEKLKRLRAAMEEAGADIHILSSLDDIAWLFNIRGDDIPCTPLVLSYAAVTMEEAVLFVHDGVISAEMERTFRKDGVRLMGYDDIYDYIAALPAGSRVLADEGRVNMALTGRVPETCELVRADNPTTLMKAVKNETEIRNTRRAHVRDGVAMVRFIFWLKHAVGKEEITEISAADRLEAFRREQDLSLGISFDTIAGFGPHGAVIHYSATPETDVPVTPEGFLLVDSGGHYLDGTTDITRTIVLGPLTDEQKKYFTAVTVSMLRLAAAKFPEGVSGSNLDCLCRQPMWDMGMDYRHGTGHGVGFLLSVHEGPQGFRWQHRGSGSIPFRAGMITTDEPGIYIDHGYGIRTENELLCVEDERTEYGQFLRFEPITYCPIDLAGIDKRYMNEQDVQRLNDYHALVYRTLKDLLPPEEADWLREATRPI